MKSESEAAQRVSEAVLALLKERRAKEAEPERFIHHTVAAERLGVSTSWLKRHAGHLRVKLGGKVMVSEQDLNRYIRQMAKGGSGL